MGVIIISQGHFRRVSGGCKSCADEDSNADLQILGNQDPKAQENHCSTSKLPMRVARQKAGLFKGNLLHWHPRTASEVPEGLQKQLFPWVEGALATFESNRLECETNAEKLAFAQNNHMAQVFLKMTDKLQKALIQDKAALFTLGDC